MKENEIIQSMAKAGFEKMFDDSWDSLADESIDKKIWTDITIEMLKSVDFPGELYQVCRMLHLKHSKK